MGEERSLSHCTCPYLAHQDKDGDMEEGGKRKKKDHDLRDQYFL